MFTFIFLFQQQAKQMKKDSNEHKLKITFNITLQGVRLFNEKTQVCGLTGQTYHLSRKSLVKWYIHTTIHIHILSLRCVILKCMDVHFMFQNIHLAFQISALQSSLLISPIST